MIGSHEENHDLFIPTVQHELPLCCSQSLSMADSVVNSESCPQSDSAGDRQATARQSVAVLVTPPLSLTGETL